MGCPSPANKGGTKTMKRDTEDFLATLLWANDFPSGWTIHEFHPEFIAAVDCFCDGFRAFCDSRGLDPDAGERSFGGNCYASLSGHGIGFWDDPDGDWGAAMQAAIRDYSGRPFRFENVDLMKFHGRIHLAYRTAACRREYLAKMFTVNP